MRFIAAASLALVALAGFAQEPAPAKITLDIYYEDTFKTYADGKGIAPEDLIAKLYWSKVIIPYWQASRVLVDIRNIEYATINAATSSATSHLTALREYLWYDKGCLQDPSLCAGLNALVTNRFYDSNVRGVAYISTVCNGQLSYSVSSMRPNHLGGIPTFPHELGHNMGASHDPSSGYIMFAAVYENTLYGGFSPQSVQEFADERVLLPNAGQPDCFVEF